jgi:DNA-binding LytR/AlgR family response regulator
VATKPDNTCCKLICWLLHLDNTKPVMTLMPMKKVLEKLPGSKFKRIHRSYIVPVARVKAIHNRKVRLSSGKELPISDSYAGFIADWQNNKL